MIIKFSILTMLLSLLNLFCSKPINEVPIDNNLYKLFFVGDSITSDDPGNIEMTGTTASRSYGWYMKQQLNDNAKYQFRNHAVSGVGITYMQDQVDTILTEEDNSKVNIVYILAPINDISAGTNGTTAYNNVVALHNTLRAQGFKTVAITLTSRRQNPPFSEGQSAAFWVHIEAFNSLMISNWASFSDCLINLQSEPERVEGPNTVGWAGYTAATASTYFADGCHWSDTGKSWMAQHYCIPAMQLLGNNQTGVITY